MAEPDQFHRPFLDMVFQHLHKGPADNGRLRAVPESIDHRQQPAGCSSGNEVVVPGLALAGQRPCRDAPVQ